MAYKEVEILLVEDNPDDEWLAMHSLRKHHVSNKIHVVRDGEEALDFIFHRGKYRGETEPHNLRLILLDIHLPKVNGLEVLEAIKSCPETKHIPVVLLTSSREQEYMLRGYTGGANSFLHKPIDFDEFDTLIKHVGYYWIHLNQSPDLLLVEPNGEKEDESLVTA